MTWTRRQETYDLENTFRYTCREGRQTYQSPLRRGFRYLMLTVRGAARSAKVYGVQVVQSNYPVAEIGQFSSSDPLLNQIYEISRHTTRLCMEDTFVDCPAYEQAFWVGDSRNEALVNYSVFGSNEIVKRCLRLVAKSSVQTPYLTDQVPSGWVSVIPNWTFLWAIACEEYVDRTEDLAFAEEVFPALCGALDQFALQLDESHLFNMRAWNLLDWARGSIPLPGGGQVDVAWTLTNSVLELTIWAPSTVTIRAQLPDGVTGSVTVHQA